LTGEGWEGAAKEGAPGPRQRPPPPPPRKQRLNMLHTDNGSGVDQSGQSVGLGSIPYSGSGFFPPSKESKSVLWPTRPLQVAVCRINPYPANVENMVSS